MIPTKYWAQYYLLSTLASLATFPPFSFPLTPSSLVICWWDIPTALPGQACTWANKLEEQVYFKEDIWLFKHQLFNFINKFWKLVCPYNTTSPHLCPPHSPASLSHPSTPLLSILSQPLLLWCLAISRHPTLTWNIYMSHWTTGQEFRKRAVASRILQYLDILFSLFAENFLNILLSRTSLKGRVTS